MDCIITFKIFFKILGTLPLQAFLNEFKNRFTTALLQRGPFQKVHCRVAAHSSCNYSGSPVVYYLQMRCVGDLWLLKAKFRTIFNLR